LNTAVIKSAQGLGATLATTEMQPWPPAAI